MCLIAFAWQSHPDYPLVVVANRDEFFDRPATPAHWWAAANGDVLAGRDARAGGSWLCVARSGRFAALTNFRDPQAARAEAPSRGRLVLDFALGTATVDAHCQQLTPIADRYNGFNLLMFDGRRVGVFESTTRRGRRLSPGVYALSNAGLDSPWPKQLAARERVAAGLESLPDYEGLFALLRDDRPAPDHTLPRTGIGLGWERMLSSAFIRAPGYGTRCSTVALFGRDGQVLLEERSWDRNGQFSSRVCEHFASDLAIA